VETPLSPNNIILGQVSAANADHDYTDSELEVMERLANLYAIAFQRQRTEDELAWHYGHFEELVQERTGDLAHPCWVI
jgi:GAF domain-containing protein